jgi:acetyl-CoA carboxylase biotin carboxylase subunit
LFDKILIANRGEIALRVIRSCRELGVKAVAVFSDVDRDTPAVWEADEAYNIGPPQALESYLNIDKIIDVALNSGAQAIHPGYGFLAENSLFASRCKEAGLVFIGPPPSAMEKMGDKAMARRTMTKAEVPVIPGSDDAVTDRDKAVDAADKVGFPLLLKPVAGGGGKGMRVVRESKELLDAFKLSQSEAKKAFGDDRIYMERYLQDPRHIEVQILADGKGNAIHLGERECSIQRRHQKLIEEAPSPIVTPELREKLGEWACQAALSAGYSSAGTVEFLMDRGGDIFFLEMNTRLQVEHPVTEMITGIDIVRIQLEIAAGEEMKLTQEDINFHGAAIECRISSEDPQNNFLPSSGKIRGYEPSGGPWVRVDSGVVVGTEITLFYDPLFAKLIVWADDRSAAINRMIRALEEFHIVGVKTTIPFHREMMDNERFRLGDYHTGFLDEVIDNEPDDGENSSTDEIAVAALLAYLKEGKGHSQVTAEATESRSSETGWRIRGREESVSRLEKWRRLRKGEIR